MSITHVITIILLGVLFLLVACTGQMVLIKMKTLPSNFAIERMPKTVPTILSIISSIIPPSTFLPLINYFVTNPIDMYFDNSTVISRVNSNDASIVAACDFDAIEYHTSEQLLLMWNLRVFPCGLYHNKV